MKKRDKIQPLDDNEIEAVIGGTDDSVPPHYGFWDWWPLGKPPWMDMQPPSPYGN